MTHKIGDKMYVDYAGKTLEVVDEDTGEVVSIERNEIVLDRDTVLDKDDLCPDIKGLVENKGCPYLDSDSDKVFDKDDQCPDVAGEVDNKGCPWPDTDNDGVLDKDDECPTTAGLLELKGCPPAPELLTAGRELREVGDEVGIRRPRGSGHVDVAVAVGGDSHEVLRDQFADARTDGQHRLAEPRCDFVRRQLLVSQGLWPMPTKTPLNAVIHGKIDQGEYTIEKVYFESAPGFFVTGNLYRPKNINGKVPAVIFPHGHWTDARFLIQPDKYVREEIATGQERFEQGGKSRFQSMCVQLARMGCVVWQIDALSDSDSKQFSPEVIHKFAKQRPEMNRTEGWGLYSPQAEANLQNVMGLQTLNSIRSVDFLLTLPEVDPTRLAVTGSSGGGT